MNVTEKSINPPINHFIGTHLHTYVIVARASQDSPTCYTYSTLRTVVSRLVCSEQICLKQNWVHT